MRILVIGLSRELPLGPADAMELADHLVKRAAAVQADGKGLWDPLPVSLPHKSRFGPGTCLWASLSASGSTRSLSAHACMW